MLGAPACLHPVPHLFKNLKEAVTPSLTSAGASATLRRALGLGSGASGKSHLICNLYPKSTSRPEEGHVYEKNYKLFVGSDTLVRRAESGRSPGNDWADTAAQSHGRHPRVLETGQRGRAARKGRERICAGVCTRQVADALSCGKFCLWQKPRSVFRAL